MKDNDNLLQYLGDQPSQPKDSEDDLLQYLPQQNQKTQIKANIYASTPIPPQAATEQYKMSRQTNLPVNIVRAQENEIKQRTELDSINYDDLVNNFPKVASQLADANKTAAIRDDVDSLSYFEKVIGNTRKEFQSNEAGAQTTNLRLKAMAFDATGNEKFKLSPLEENELALNEQEQKQRNVDYQLGLFKSDTTELLAKIPGYTIGQIPNIVQTAKTAIPAALGGFAVSGLNPAGAAVGGGLGAFSASSRRMTADAYDEYKGYVDETGKPIEKQVAAGAALLTGGVGGAIELFPGAVLTAPIRKLFTKEGAKELLKTSAGREALKNIAGGMIAEGGAEAAQEYTNIAFGEGAKYMSEGKFKSFGVDKEKVDADAILNFLGSDEVKKRVKESAIAGAVGGGGFGAASSAVTYASAVAQKRTQDAEDKGLINQIYDRIKESKIFKRSPELLKEVTDDTLGEQNAYFNPEEVQTFFQTKSPEELQQFDKILPEMREQLNAALDTGSKIVLPTNKALIAFAQNEGFSDLKNIMSFSPESLNEKEAQDAFLNDAVSNVGFEEQKQQRSKDEGAVKNNIKNQVLGLRLPTKDAQDIITTLTSYYDTKSQRYGSEEAQGVLDTYLKNLQVKNGVKNIRSIDDLDSFINQARKFTPQKRTKPLLKFLKEKGGVRLDSNLAGELKSIGLTPKTAPGLFKKDGGIGDVDNIPLSEFNERFPNVETNVGTDYVDRQAVLDLIGREVGGEDISQVQNEDQEKMARFLEDLDRIGIELGTASNEDVKKAIDGFKEDENTFFQPGNEDTQMKNLYEEARKFKTEKEFVKSVLNNSNISLNPRIKAIQINKISGSDYVELDQALKDNKKLSIDQASEIIAPTDEYQANKQIIYPIEVQLNKDGSYSLQAGNHRLAQTLINGDRTILANVLGDRSGQSLSEIYNEAKTLFQGQSKAPQGATQFFGQKPIISLFKSANRSTLLHELGHVFLQIEKDISKLPNVSAQTKSDWATIEQWLGIKDGKITLEAHEKFARGFEAYLREGKAPSIGLRNAFRRFKSWLTNIYKNVKSLNVELNKDVRAVFDRMLATDEAIDNLKNNPIFRADEKILAMLDDEEKAKYLALTENADERAKEKLLSRSLKQLEKEKSKTFKEQKEKLKQSISEELAKTPVYRALESLRSEDGFKINAADIESFEGNFIKRLPKDIISEDGVAVDMAAEFLGFADGGVMLNELANAPSLKSEVNRLTNEALAQQAQDNFTEEKVINTSQNDARAKKILYELNVANSKVKTFVDTKESYEQKAKDTIGRQQVKESANSYVFYLNEVKAAREAGVALGAKDYEKAVEWKKKQLLNHYLYRESLKVKDEVEDLRKRSIRYNKKPVAGKVWIEEDYRERIVGLLEDFNLVENTIGHEKTNISALEAWKKEQAQEGVLGLVDFSEIATFQDKDNIRNLTTNQFRDLDNAISNLAHVGQGLRTLEIEGKRVEIDAIADEIVELVNKNIKKDKPSLADPTALEKLKRDFDSYSSSVIKTSQTTLKIDGEENLGKFYNYFERNVNFSEIKKEEMKEDAYKKFDEIFNKHFGGYKITNKRTTFDQVGTSYSKPAVLAFALNWGNEINRRRVRDGFGYNNNQITSILSSLTKNELGFVQDVWDMVNSYWPQVEATQKKLFGFAPKKQRAIPFVLKSSDGQIVKMKGGYYPIAFSKEASLRSDTKEDLIEFFAGSAADKISFHASYTKERSEEKIEKKIDLTLNPLTKHISQVITDISMKEAVWNSYKIINNRKLSTALIKKIGLADYKQLQTWLYDMYGRTLVQEGYLGKLASLSRAIATTYAMGFKVATALIQVTGILNSITKIGYGNMGNGVWKALGNGNPVSINQATKLAYAKSKILENRSKTINREIYEVMDRLQKSGKMTKAVAKFAFLATTKAQMLVDIPTWYGGYYKGLKDFKGDDSKAAELADRLLIETQGSSYKQSRSAIERSEAGIVKAFTAFYSYMNVKLNLLAGSYRKNDFKKPKDLASFSSDFLLLFFTDALVTEFLREGVSNLLAGRDSEDDEEENKALHYTNLVGQTLASSVPGVSQFYSGLSGYSYFPAGFKGFEIFGKGVKTLGAETIKSLSDDEEADLLKTLRGLNDSLSIFTVGGGGQIDIFLRAAQEQEKGNDVAPIDYILKPPK